MIIRTYQAWDCLAIIELFKDTVLNVNCQDYNPEQLQAWIRSSEDVDGWNNAFLEHRTLVALEDNKIVGFADMTDDGFLDRLYVHKDYQQQHIGKALCDELEAWIWQQGCVNIRTHASITAKPFYEKRGYKVICEQYVQRENCKLKNYIMEKTNNDSFEIGLNN